MANSVIQRFNLQCFTTDRTLRGLVHLSTHSFSTGTGMITNRSYSVYTTTMGVSRCTMGPVPSVVKYQWTRTVLFIVATIYRNGEIVKVYPESLNLPRWFSISNTTWSTVETIRDAFCIRFQTKFVQSTVADAVTDFAYALKRMNTDLSYRGRGNPSTKSDRSKLTLLDHNMNNEQTCLTRLNNTCVMLIVRNSHRTTKRPLPGSVYILESHGFHAHTPLMNRSLAPLYTH